MLTRDEVQKVIQFIGLKMNANEESDLIDIFDKRGNNYIDA